MESFIGSIFYGGVDGGNTHTCSVRNTSLEGPKGLCLCCVQGRRSKNLMAASTRPRSAHTERKCCHTIPRYTPLSQRESGCPSGVVRLKGIFTRSIFELLERKYEVGTRDKMSFYRRASSYIFLRIYVRPFLQMGPAIDIEPALSGRCGTETVLRTTGRECMRAFEFLTAVFPRHRLWDQSLGHASQTTKFPLPAVSIWALF